MKYLWYAFMTLLALPAGIGFADCWWWIMTGHPLSWVPWDVNRAFSALALVFPALLTLLNAWVEEL